MTARIAYFVFLAPERKKNMAAKFKGRAKKELEERVMDEDHMFCLAFFDSTKAFDSFNLNVVHVQVFFIRSKSVACF